MAAYVFNEGPKPHELREAQRIQKWGNPTRDGYLSWQFGKIEKMDYALNVFEICRAWERTKPENQGEWIESNPAAWNLIIAPILEMGLNDGRQESWL